LTKPFEKYNLVILNITIYNQFAHSRSIGTEIPGIGVVKKIGFVLIIVLLIPSMLSAKRQHPEKWYQKKWCEAHNGQLEVALPDGTRCDCLTDTHAIEFDFGSKWAEAVGQSAYYSLQTQKKAGIVLILENPKGRKYWLRLNSTIQHLNMQIETWSIGNASY
jgi:hypothetical protein